PFWLKAFPAQAALAPPLPSEVQWMGVSAPAEEGAEPLQRAGDGTALAGRAAVVFGARPARATGSPAAAVAGSVLARGLVPCEPRVPALDLAAVAADRARACEPEVAPFLQGHPPRKEVVRAAPEQRGPGLGALALQRFGGHVLEGLAARRLQGRGPATESLLFPGLTVASPRRAGGGGKAALGGAASSSTAATDAGAAWSPPAVPWAAGGEAQ
ncbi:unnamed protein product, partial [Prorocentrum cordatum]